PCIDITAGDPIDKNCCRIVTGSDWGSSSAVESLRECCLVSKTGNFLAKTKELRIRSDQLKSLVSALQKCKPELTDNKGESSQTTDTVWKKENSLHSKMAKKAEQCRVKVDEALKEVEDIKKEALNLLNYCEFKESRDETDTTENMERFKDLIQYFKQHADSFKLGAISLKIITNEQIEGLHDSQSNAVILANTVNDSFIKISDLLDDLASLIKDGVKEKLSIEENILDKSIQDICISCSKQCIQAGRNICQSLLGYPKNDNQPTSDSVFQDLLVWAILVNRPKLATIFWMKCKNQLCKGRCGSNITKRLNAFRIQRKTILEIPTIAKTRKTRK
ncbi:hypothetical protein AM593_03837, partial [Mytilus galloprovincialis]